LENTLTRNKHISTVALVVALLALVASLAGGAVAGGFIGSDDIKKNAVKSKHVKNNSLKSKDIKDGTLKGADIKDGSLGKGELAPGTLSSTVGFYRSGATAGADYDAARSAAPEHVLFTAGPFTVYSKCFTNTGGPTTWADVYIRTSTNGAVIDADYDDWDGGPADTDFLTTSTAENDRQIIETNATDFYGAYDSIFNAVAANGFALNGEVALGANSGATAFGGGPYGAGDACIFTWDYQTS
jgi:hypothetical protein